MEENYFISAVKVGQQVPNFAAEAVMPDGSFGKVSLEENMKNGKWTVMFFWPLDFTFVCPTEITALSDAYDKFAAEDVEIFGVSTDSIHSHKAWRNLDRANGGIGEIKFPMLQDTTHAISEQFGVLIEDEGIALRGIFIISPEGELQSATINNLNVGRNVDEVLRTIHAFKSGGLCAMNWHKGDANL